MIAFFGMDGPFSVVLLRALATAGHSPKVVVVGVPQPELTREPLVRWLPSRPRSGWSRLLGGSADELGSDRDVHLAAAARELGIDLLATSDPGALRARAQLKEIAPEALVVAGFPRLLPPEVLLLAPKGGLNVHPGRLPQERGPSPVFWALKNGRTQLGLAIHVLDPGEDSGDVVASAEYTIEPGMDLRDVFRRCAQHAAPHLVRSLRGLLAGDLVRTPQPVLGRGRCPRPEFRDGQIDPERPAEEVFTFVAACARIHSLFVEIAGDRFFVAAARSFDPRRKLPCEYVVQGNLLLLSCSPGVVELELKPEGAIFSADYAE